MLSKLQILNQIQNRTVGNTMEILEAYQCDNVKNIVKKELWKSFKEIKEQVLLIKDDSNNENNQ